MGFVKLQLSELHVLNKTLLLMLMQLCLAITSSPPRRMHQKIVRGLIRFESFH